MIVEKAWHRVTAMVMVWTTGQRELARGTTGKGWGVRWEMYEWEGGIPPAGTV